MRVLITGAASGIGAATARKLKARGDEVVALDITRPKGVDRWIEVDMSDSASIDAALAQLTGTFDCLISNAGLPPREGMAAKVLAVNFTGMVQVANAVIPLLNKGGSIVTTASRAGAFWRENIDEVKALLNTPKEGLEAFIAAHGIDDTRAYNLSKEAAIVWSLAQTERLIGLGLRINTVSPSAVSTGILDDFVAAFGDRVAQNVARVGRPGTPDEVADAIVFLASKESFWIKGQDLTLDGGMSALALTDELGIANPSI